MSSGSNQNNSHFFTCLQLGSLNGLFCLEACSTLSKSSCAHMRCQFFIFILAVHSSNFSKQVSFVVFFVCSTHSTLKLMCAHEPRLFFVRCLQFFLFQTGFFLSTLKRIVHSHARAVKTLEAFVLSALVLFGQCQIDVQNTKYKIKVENKIGVINF